MPHVGPVLTWGFVSQAVHWALDPHHASFFLDYLDGIERNEIFCTKLGLHSAYENSTFFSGAYFAGIKNEGYRNPIMFPINRTQIVLVVTI